MVLAVTVFSRVFYPPITLSSVLFLSSFGVVAIVGILRFCFSICVRLACIAAFQHRDNSDRRHTKDGEPNSLLAVAFPGNCRPDDDYPQCSRDDALSLGPGAPIRRVAYAVSSTLQCQVQASPGAAATVARHIHCTLLKIGYQSGLRGISAKFLGDFFPLQKRPISNGHSRHPSGTNNLPNHNHNGDPSSSLVDPSLLHAAPEISPSNDASGTSSNGTRNVARDTPRKRRRKQPNGSPNDSGSDNDGEGPQSENQAGISVPSGGKSFACPFLKLDPHRYHAACSGKKHSNVSRVVQHIKRSHILPQHYCSVCWRQFKSLEELRGHSGQQACQWMDPEEIDLLSPDDCTNGSLSTTARLSDCQKWYELWDKLFPLHRADRPLSPYDEPLQTQELLAHGIRRLFPALMVRFNVPLNTQDSFQEGVLAMVCSIINPPRRYRHKPPQAPALPPELPLPRQSLLSQSPRTALVPEYMDPFVGHDDLAEQQEGVGEHGDGGGFQDLSGSHWIRGNTDEVELFHQD